MAKVKGGEMTEVTLYDFRLLDDLVQDGDCVAAITKLTVFNSRLSGGRAGRVRQFTRLKAVLLLYCSDADDFVHEIAGTSSLEELSLVDSPLSDVGTRGLAALPRLTRLCLSPANSESVECLQGLTQLRELRLAGIPLTHPSVTSLRRALPECRIREAQAK